MGDRGTGSLSERLITDFVSRRDLGFRRTDVLVFIPIYNEKDSIAAVIDGIKTHCQFDILVIDDGSTDSTPVVLEKLGVAVLRHPRPLGSKRILHGLEIALSFGYKYALKIDGDGQHDPGDIMRLYERAVKNKDDLIIASRHLDGFRTIIWSVSGSGMWFCAALVSLISRRRITDTTSGFKIWSRKACETAVKAAREGKLKDASTFHIEELVLAARKQLRVEEISVTMHPRQFGDTKSFSPRKKLLFPFKLVVSTIRALV